MSGQSSPRLLLICGLPGSGKTTLARRLAVELPAVRLGGDEWMATLGLDLHDETARDRLEVQFWQLTQDLLTFGQSVILESGFWLRSDRDEKRLGARRIGAAVELRYLNVPFDQLWRRLEKRNQLGTWGAVPISRDQLCAWAQFFEAPEDAELELFDAPA
jgi:predicted kinase